MMQSRKSKSDPKPYVIAHRHEMYGQTEWMIRRAGKRKFTGKEVRDFVAVLNVYCAALAYGRKLRRKIK